MKRLIRTEVTRFNSRRIPWAIVAGVLLITLISVLVAYFRLDPNEFSATVILGEETSDWSENRLPECCAFGNSIDGEPVRGYQEGMSGIVSSLSGSIFMILAVVVGGSFVGAEYRFGTVENLLLWEPRRSRVLAAKFIGGAIGTMVFFAVLIAGMTAILLALAALRGNFTGVDGRFWIDLVLVTIRAGIMGAAFCVISMSVATIAKNTVASVFGILGWFIASNIVISLLIKWFRPFEPLTNAEAFVGEGDMWKTQSVSFGDVEVYSHGWLMAGVVVVVWAVVAATIASVVFARRDIS